MFSFRLPEHPLTGYWLGTSALALTCWVIGEYSIALAFRINKAMIKEDVRKMDHFQELSFAALRSGDKSAFKACNDIANEAYGKSFFTQITLSAASLWPLFVALGWMQHRFSDIEFAIPLTGWTAGYFSTFLFCYITIRLLSGKLRRLFCQS
ncbi:MAG TPA: hypothetical protein ENH18_02515 [Nitrospirae bacterium]|nr:hypothetical protein [Nitrospirota bacterium]HEW81223.1 hypothetical protein [Nitrospirota bacterium]